MTLVVHVLRLVGPALAPRHGLRKRRPCGPLIGPFATTLAVAIAALILAPLAAAQAAGTDVIHPRAAVQADAPAGAGPEHSPWPLATAFGLCAAAGGVMWFRRRQPGTSGMRAAKKLSITETRPLGNRQHLVVADYDGRKFLLGVCPGRIEMLTALEEPEQGDES